VTVVTLFQARSVISYFGLVRLDLYYIIYFVIVTLEMLAYTCINENGGGKRGAAD